MKIARSLRPTPEERAALIQGLESDASIHTPFVVLTVASCVIATIGLIANSAAVVIGAMIIAPLMSPMTSLAFGLVNGTARLARQSLITLASGILVSLVVSALIALLTGLPSYGSEILARSQPTILDLGVALAAGAIAAYARMRPEVSATLAGTAIAVALMPPLCTVGIAISHADLLLARGALLLFLSNLLGITFACMIAYAISGHVRWHRARGGFIGTAVLIVVISIPLVAQFGRLLNQARLEQTLRSALLTGTVTFHRVTFVQAQFDWLTSPPTVRIIVRSETPITPTQVRLLEAYAQRKTGRDFQLVFDVTPQTTVTDEPTPAPSPLQP